MFRQPLMAATAGMDRGYHLRPGRRRPGTDADSGQVAAGGPRRGFREAARRAAQVGNRADQQHLDRRQIDDLHRADGHRVRQGPGGGRQQLRADLAGRPVQDRGGHDDASERLDLGPPAGAVRDPPRPRHRVLARGRLGHGAVEAIQFHRDHGQELPRRLHPPPHLRRRKGLAGQPASGGIRGRHAGPAAAPAGQHAAKLLLRAGHGRRLVSRQLEAVARGTAQPGPGRHR